jgi:hypothetical protein
MVQKPVVMVVRNIRALGLKLEKDALHVMESILSVESG